METKLTLRINNEVIIRAKDYAQSHKTSLSRLIESYLDSVTNTKSADIGITPLVESLSGVIKLPDVFDYKKEYANWLDEKYK